MDIKMVGVVGSGVMGRGIAQCLAETGHYAILFDISQAQLDAAKAEMIKNIRMQGFFSSQVKSPDCEDILRRVVFTQDMQCLAEVPYIIENLPERVAF